MINIQTMSTYPVEHQQSIIGALYQGFGIAGPVVYYGSMFLTMILTFKTIELWMKNVGLDIDALSFRDISLNTTIELITSNDDLLKTLQIMMAIIILISILITRWNLSWSP